MTRDALTARSMSDATSAGEKRNSLWTQPSKTMQATNQMTTATQLSDEEVVRIVAVDLYARFWERVNKSDGCWNWIRPSKRSGYGRISYRYSCGVSRYMLAHRLSWIIHYGSIPDDLLVCHTCDNPACVRPDHLFVGTDLDNCNDKIRKGRYGGGFTTETAPRLGYSLPGESNPTHKLTAAQVSAIRAEAAPGNFNVLGKRYGVSRSTVSLIYHGKRWNTLPAPTLARAVAASILAVDKQTP